MLYIFIFLRNVNKSTHNVHHQSSVYNVSFLELDSFNILKITLSLLKPNPLIFGVFGRAVLWTLFAIWRCHGAIDCFVGVIL